MSADQSSDERPFSGPISANIQSEERPFSGPMSANIQSEERPLSGPISANQFNCSVCEKTFSSKSNLTKHMKAFHPDVEIQDLQLTQVCGICQMKLRNVKSLQRHIAAFHKDINLNFETKIFYCEEDFKKWKSDEEKDSQSLFVKHRGAREVEDVISVLIFNCHRSGTVKIKESKSKLRHMKFGGSIKAGATCPANMKVTTTKVNEAFEIIVEYQSVHVGHKIEVGKLPLSAIEKGELAAKLVQGVPTATILSDIQEQYSPTKRLGLTNKKDLHNICRDLKINKTRLHPDDSISVELLVKKMQEEEYDPILVYKPCGNINPQYPSLGEEEFVLGIMTEAQQRLLESHGSSCVMIDSTHGTNQYGLQLTTLMVNDFLHEGFPVAIFYSTSVAADTLLPFFENIKKRVSIKTNVFMSDDAPAFHNAWKEVFQDNSKHLICAWHIIRSWARNLNAKVKDRDLRKIMMSELKKILHEVDVVTYQSLCEDFCRKYCVIDDAKDFIQYFQIHYCMRSEKWAYCYRTGCGINTNMKLERWHRQLKYEESAGKIIKRLDASICMVLSAISKKIISQIIALERGKLTTRVSNIRQRHKKITEMSSYSYIEMESRKSYTILKSSDNSIISYRVEFSMHCDCTIRCDDCDICIHSYSCTCIDYAVRYQICKHIHFICQALKEQTNVSTLEEDENNMQDELIIDERSTDVVKNDLKHIVANSVKDKSVKNLKEREAKVISDIVNIVRANCSAENIGFIEACASTFVAQCSAPPTASPLPPILKGMTKAPANKQILPQVRLPPKKKQKRNETNI